MKVSTLEKLQFLLLFFALQFYTAQVIPQISYKDFGFEKKIAKFEKVTFEFKDKVALDREKEIYIFNEEGNIAKVVSETYGNQENLEATVEYFYKDGKLIKEVGTFPNDKQMNFSSDYIFDEKNNIISSKFDGDGYEEKIKYHYKNNRLEKSTGDYNGTSGSEQYYYNPKGQLYKKVHKDSFSEEKNTSTNLYHNGKEIARYTENYIAPRISSIDKKANFNYNINTEKGILKLKDLEQKLSNGETIGLEDVPGQIFKWGKENKDLSCSNGQFSLYKDSEVIATADVEKPFTDLEILTFYEITYPDGSKAGSTDFNFFYYNELKSYLKVMKP